VGGSSGSAATLLFSRLVVNKKFGVSKDGFATHDQARSIARALAFMSLATDLGNTGLSTVLGRVVRTKFADWGKNAWSKDTLSSVDTQTILYIFGPYIAAARLMDPKWADVKVADIIGNYCKPKIFKYFSKDKSCKSQRQKELAERASMSSAVDLPMVPFKFTAKKQKDLEGVMAKVSARAMKIVGAHLKQKGYTWKQRNGIKVTRNMNLVDKRLNPKPEEGFMTMAFAHPRDKVEDGVKDVDYGSKRILVMMSESTAELILQSAEYKKAVRACLKTEADTCKRMSRYIIATVGHMRPMLVISTMEPGFVKPYVARLSEMGITSMFDPTIQDANVIEGDDWQLQKTSKALHDNPRMLIVGGYVDRVFMRPLQEYYVQGKGLPNVQYHLFGKHDYSSVSMDAVKDLLSDDEASAAANWKDYMNWANQPCSDCVNVTVNHVCGAYLPGNLAYGAWDLRLHGAARTRIAVEELFGNEGDERKIFDPMSKCESWGKPINRLDRLY